MSCWYCYWGWPRPVLDVYLEAVEALGGRGEHALESGPAHIVWADENWEDDHVGYCLNECGSNRDAYPDHTDAEIAVVEESLARLLAIPEEIRCCKPEGYDEDGDEGPGTYPPPPGVECVRR